MSCVSLRLRVDAAGTVRACVRVASPRYLVFDVETDGGSPLQHCIQLAFVVLDDAFREVFRYDQYWRLAPGRRVNPFSTGVHAIDDNVLAARGVCPRAGLATFFAWADRVATRAEGGGLLVAHNAAFDAKVLQNMCDHYGVRRALSKQDCFCLMVQGAKHAGLKDRAGRRKRPRNDELYTVLHAASPAWATLHDALDDVRVTAANLRAGRARGWW